MYGPAEHRILFMQHVGSYLFHTYIGRYIRLFHSCQALTCSLPQGVQTQVGSLMRMTNGEKDMHESQVSCFRSKQQLFLPN